jgi:hypothetical protein
LFEDAALPKQVHGTKTKVAQDGFFRSGISCSVKKGCRPLGAGAAPGRQDILLSCIDILYDTSILNVNSKNKSKQNMPIMIDYGFRHYLD